MTARRQLVAKGRVWMRTPPAKPGTPVSPATVEQNELHEGRADAARYGFCASLVTVSAAAMTIAPGRRIDLE
jgi:hypothetical protein